MKKYDFWLLGLYILPVILFFIIGSGWQRQENNAKRQAIARFEKIYQTPVKTIVFENTHAKCVVKGPGYNHAITNGLEFSGGLDIRFLDDFRISGDTLRISESFENFVSTPGSYTIHYFNLHISDDIKVDTINAPNITIERQEVLKDTVQDGI